MGTWLTVSCLLSSRIVQIEAVPSAWVPKWEGHKQSHSQPTVATKHREHSKSFPHGGLRFGNICYSSRTYPIQADDMAPLTKMNVNGRRGFRTLGLPSKEMGSSRDVALLGAPLWCSGPSASSKSGERSHRACHSDACPCPADTPVPCPQVLRLCDGGGAKQGHCAAVWSHGRTLKLSPTVSWLCQFLSLKIIQNSLLLTGPQGKLPGMWVGSCPSRLTPQRRDPRRQSTLDFMSWLSQTPPGPKH